MSLVVTCSAAPITALKASAAPGKLHLSGCTFLASFLREALMLLASEPGCSCSTWATPQLRTMQDVCWMHHTSFTCSTRFVYILERLCECGLKV